MLFTFGVKVDGSMGLSLMGYVVGPTKQRFVSENDGDMLHTVAAHGIVPWLRAFATF